MSPLEANLALLSTTPEDFQKEMQNYLVVNSCGNNPYKPLSEKEINLEVTEVRKCYDNGEGGDFDKAFDEIRVRYRL